MLQKKKTPPSPQSCNSRSFFVHKKNVPPRSQRTYLLALKVVTRDPQSLKLYKNAAKNGGGGGLASLISQVPRKSQRFACEKKGGEKLNAFVCLLCRITEFLLLFPHLASRWVVLP
jgi:hypothetical protein